METSQPDGDDEFWPVLQIIEESARQFKVEWVGIDPATGAPWPPSWVPKSDCTDDIVVKWREKKKPRPKEEGSRKSGRASGESVFPVVSAQCSNGF